MTLYDLVREYFPDASDDECGFILWNKTAFPFVEVDHLREQLSARWCAIEGGFELSDCCGRLFLPGVLDDFCFCDPCKNWMHHDYYLDASYFGGGDCRG